MTGLEVRALCLKIREQHATAGGDVTVFTLAIETEKVLDRIAELEAQLAIVETAGLRAAELWHEAEAKVAETRDGQAWGDLVKERDRALRDVELAQAVIGQVFTERRVVERQVAAMRPVVEAAKAWRVDPRSALHLPHAPTEAGLIAAVDAYGAGQHGQDGASGGLSATGPAVRHEIRPKGHDGWACSCGESGQGGSHATHGATWRPAPRGTDPETGPGKLVPGQGDVTAEPQAAPADPVGLDAAVGAAAQAINYDDDYFGDGSDLAERAVRAAAPHIRAAALREAADWLEAEADRVRTLPSKTEGYNETVGMGLLGGARLIRKRVGG